METSVDLYLTAEPQTGVVDLTLPPRAEPERRHSRAYEPAGSSASIAGAAARDSIYDALIGSGALAMAALDESCIRFASPAFLRLLGLTSTQAETATSWCRRVHSADRERVRALLVEALENGRPISTSCKVTEPGGGAVRVHLAGYPAGPTSPGVFTVLLHVDVSSRTVPVAPRLPAPAQRAFARSRSEILDRTGELLVDAWLKSESLAVLAVGLNAPAPGLSPHGRAAATAALMERLRPCLRDGDVIGSNGDDGLLIAIPNLNGASSAGIVAGRLIEAARPRTEADQDADQGADQGWNIGIALFPDDDQELSGLLNHASAALEFARQCGPYRYSLAETSLNLSMNPVPMPWDEQLKAGMPELDAQHSRVLDELRDLSHVIGTGSDLSALQAGMDAMIEALVADFRYEEALMRENPGPSNEAHRKEHARVLRNVGLLAHADTRQGLALAARFVHQWLGQHIREYDAPLVVTTFRPLW